MRPCETLNMSSFSFIPDPLSQASQNATEDLIDLHTPLEYGKIQKVTRQPPHAPQRVSRENLKLDLKVGYTVSLFLATRDQNPQHII